MLEKTCIVAHLWLSEVDPKVLLVALTLLVFSLGSRVDKMP